MTLPVMAWVLSLLGACLFFVAGVLFAMRKATARADDEKTQPFFALPDEPTERARLDVVALVEDLKVHKSEGSEQRPGNVLEAILREQTRGSDFAGAVIADELGLVVASTGEYGDALAAYGAFLAGIGAKTSDALPLHDIRQVVVQDEHDMVLTVRPIAAADDHFSLVTLASRQQHDMPVRASAAQGR